MGPFSISHALGMLLRRIDKDAEDYGLQMGNSRDLDQKPRALTLWWHLRK
jgi:hypothetical protein